MKKTRTTYEQATKEYTEYYNETPTVQKMEGLYHAYATNWKHYNGFTDWLIYTMD